MKDMLGLFSTLNELEPEIAKKAIEQFPELARTSVMIAKQFCEISLDTLKKHQESSKDSLLFLRERANFIEGLVNAGLTSEEDTRYFVDKLMELSRMAIEVHKDDHNFFFKFLSENGKLLGGFLFITIAALGVNGRFKIPELAKA